MRAVVLALLAAILAGCAAASPTTDPTASETDPRDQVLVELRDEVADVADAQTDADEAVADVLAGVRAVDEGAPPLARAATFEDALDGWAAVHEAVDVASVTGLRRRYLAVADDVDAARQTLASARGQLDDPWEVRYLDAQDTVLLAVREHARVADQLAQLLVQHWPTYTDVDARVTDFASRRGNYRDTQEATDALAVELDTVLDDLAVAEGQIAEWRAKRADAAEAVNEATADAVAIWEQRPDGAGG